MADRVELIIALQGDQQALAALSSIESSYRNLNGKRISVGVDNSSLNQGASNMNHLGDSADRAASRIEKVADALSAVSHALDAIGSINDSIMSFGNGIASAFEGAANMFSFSVIDKALDTFTSMITQKVFGSFENVIARYDIMSTFGSYMSLMGVSQADSDKALQRVNESILGLPIGLDEAAYRLRRYQMFIGDIEKTTDFTIGIQKALLAGGADETMRTQAYRQIERLLTTGTLSTSRQWMSLLNGMGVSVQFLAEELGYAGMSGKELAAALYTGKISSDEFLGAIESLGRGTSDAAKRMDAALSIYKGTIDSWMRSIEFAFTRGGTGTLEALNRMLVVETDVSIVGYMEKFRNAVDRAYAEAQQWIDENPGSFVMNFEALENLGDSLSRFSVGDIVGQGLENISEFINAISAALNQMDPDRTENFVAFATTIAGPLAAIAKISGQLGVVEGVINRFSDYDWTSLFTELAGAVNNVADLTESVLNLIPDSVMNQLLVFAWVYAPLVAKAIQMIQTAIGGLQTVLPYLQTLWDLMTSLSAGQWFVIAAAIGAVALAIHNFNQQKLNAREVYGLDDVSNMVAESKSLRDDISDTISDHDKNLEKIAAQRDRAEEILTKIDDLNKRASEGDQTAAVNLQAAVDQFNRLFPELQINIDGTTGLLDANSEAIARNASAYADAIQAVREYNENVNYLNTLSEQRSDLRVRLTGLKAQRESLANSISDLLADMGYEVPTDGNWLSRGFRTFLLDVTTGFDNAVNGNNAALKVLGESYEEVDAEITAATAQLDSMNLAMYEASQAVDQGAQALTDSAEAAEVYSNAQYSAVSSTESVTAAVHAQAEALDVLIGKYDEYKTASYEALHSAVSGFEEIQTKKDYDFAEVLAINAEKMKGYRNATDLMSEALANAMLTGMDSDIMYTYFADLLSSGNYDAVIQAGERIAAGLLENDLQLYAESLAAIEPSSLNAALVQSLRDNKQSAMVGILSGEIPVSGDAWLSIMNQYNEDLNKLIENYGYNTETGGFMNVDVDELEAAMEALNEFTAKYFGNGEDSDDGTATAAFQYLNDLMNSMKEETMPELEKAYGTLGTAVDEFTGKVLVPLVQEHQNATKETDNQKTATENLANMLTERDFDFMNFATRLNDIETAAAGAASQLQAVAEAVGAIPEMPTLSGALTNNMGAAFGDAVYRASGGPIFGPYTGYDNIPAMLTPGEFVIRRGSAQVLGRSFLENINRLNIPGAMDALMKQAIPMPGHFVAYNNSRSYDNHAQVIQNINTNNAAFTYRRASRFVGAL